MTLAYITCKNKKEAERISKHLLEKRIIACSNMMPMRSMYRWNSKIENANEMLIIAKTNDRNFNKIITETRKIHSYKLPCIVKIDSKASKDFENWAEKEMR